MFRYVTSSNRCPLCGGSTDCRENDSGVMFCRRTPPSMAPVGWRYGTLDRHGFNVWFPEGHEETHWAEWAQKERGRVVGGGGGAADGGGGGGKKKARQAAADSTFGAITRDHRPLAEHERALLSFQLCLEPEIFAALPISGWKTANNQFAWVWPEKDGFEKPIGWSVRFRNGKKLAYGNRGLIIPDGWDRQQPGGAVFIPEGMSDTLGLVAMGLNVVGRPSNTGGTEHLVELLERAGFREDTGRRIVVLGENDQKESGAWPGREGAEKVAGALSRRLRRPVQICYPPAGYKDIREWITAHRERLDRGEKTMADMGDDFREHVMWAAEEIGGVSKATGAAPSLVVTPSPIAAPVASLPAPPPITIDEIAATPASARPSPFAVLHACPRPNQFGMKHELKRLARVMFAPCKKLDCPYCGPRKRAQYKATARVRIDDWAKRERECSLYDDPTLYLFWCDGKSWAAIYSHLKRGWAEYYRLLLDDGTFLVVSTVKPLERHVPEQAVKAVGVEEAKARLMSAIERLPSMANKTFTGSKEWKRLVGSEKQSRMAGWTRVSKFVIPREKIVEILEFRRVEFSIKKHVGAFWDWMAYEWSEVEARGQTDQVFFEMQVGESLPDLEFGGDEGDGEKKRDEWDGDIWGGGAGPPNEDVWVDL
jgi:hypothetical protein